MYLLTNPHTNIAGCYEISLKTMCFDTDIKLDRLSKIIDKLSQDRKVLYMNGHIIIANFIKHQRINDKVKAGIERCINDLPDCISRLLSIDYDSLSIDYDIPELKLKPKLKLESKDHRGVKTNRFSPPTQKECNDYFLENDGDKEMAMDFWEFYESKGWMVGKSKMKKWQMAASRWIRAREKESSLGKILVIE